VTGWSPRWPDLGSLDELAVDEEIADRSSAEVFVPQSHRPGAAAEVVGRGLAATLIRLPAREAEGRLVSLTPLPYQSSAFRLG